MSFLDLCLTHNTTTLSESFSYFFDTFVSVLVMVDPFAIIPVYLMITERFTANEVQKIRRKTIIVATSILLLFALTGMGVLHFFTISMPALRIAGGILLLRFALEQMKGDHPKINIEDENEGMHRDNISIVPLAMPFIAGPGAISTIVVQSTNATNLFNFSLLILAILSVLLVTFLILKYSQYLYVLLGKTGLNLLGKIMGILVAAIAIEFMIIGIKEAFPHLGQ